MEALNIVYGNKGRYYSGPRKKILKRWDSSVFLPICKYVYVMEGLTKLNRSPIGFKVDPYPDIKNGNLGILSDL